ncbi:MarR family winged helix-turn-helix transcriptional regulator [Rhizohabitans arisaemae]|uniref:MarR family winged helix-turn-helix transcriptional regulator n=1 Tax=Rhizohabitans arisaemae TaxID=2720610 RepID=UPI0024B16536|nr:MarR family transcriptional regulator [Rhizohabitans arisaemae]
MDEKNRLIEQIEGMEADLIRLHTRDQSDELLNANLTIQQIRVLMLLNLDDGIPTHDLAANLGVGLATATGIVDRLESRDLVRRAEDPADRRVRRIELTRAGRQMIGDIVDAGRERRQRVLLRMDVEMLRTLAVALNGLCSAMEDDIAEQRAAGSAG